VTPREDTSIEWEISVDHRDGFDGMKVERTVKKRYYTVTMHHVLLLILALTMSAWGGIFALGYYAARWLP
jgi:hypothetical protein